MNVDLSAIEFLGAMIVGALMTAIWILYMIHDDLRGLRKILDYIAKKQESPWD